MSSERFRIMCATSALSYAVMVLHVDLRPYELRRRDEANLRAEQLALPGRLKPLVGHVCGEVGILVMMSTNCSPRVMRESPRSK